LESAWKVRVSIIHIDIATALAAKMRARSFFDTNATLLALLALAGGLHALPLTRRQTNYTQNAVTAAQRLNNDWYSASTGRWQNLWWNS
jgi:hypothetical protein